MSGQRVSTGVEAFLTGLISTGVGEAPSRFSRGAPGSGAAANATIVVATTVLGAAITHLIQLASSGCLSAIPWNLIVWSVPGAIIRATVGTHFQGKIGEKAWRIFFSLLFLLIGVTFLTAFTVFKDRFGDSR